jgi:uncharacterized coiled-coil DUF342 family protein
MAVIHAIMKKKQDEFDARMKKKQDEFDARMKALQEEIDAINKETQAIREKNQRIREEKNIEARYAKFLSERRMIRLQCSHGRCVNNSLSWESLSRV